MDPNAARRSRRLAAAPVAALALTIACTPAFAAASHPLPLWRVSDTHGHRLYLAGSMHALRAADYPLPAPFAAAFDRSRRLVEELDLNAISPAEIRDAIRSFCRLPKGETLGRVMGTDWPRTQKLAAKAGVDLANYQRYKPWFAAVRIAAKRFVAAGYTPDLGLDRHFANLAKKRKMPVAGLETLDEQMGFLDAIAPALQRRFLLQTLEEAPRVKGELAALHKAWRNGDTATLAKISDRNFAGYPKLRGQLLGARNRRWLPRIERCLKQNGGCFVVVGVEHMIGPAGLLALFRKAGYRVVQLHGENLPATPSTAAARA